MQQTKYQGNYITVTEEVINNHIYERVRLRAGVHVIPVRDNKVLFMHEHRTHEHKPRWKLVSGWCDKDNTTPLLHAQEELAEELGMQAGYWEELYNTIAPGATVDPNTYYFLCRDISELDTKIINPDHGCEVLGYRWMNSHDVYTALNAGEMWMDDSALAALRVLHNEEKNQV